MWRLMIEKITFDKQSGKRRLDGKIIQMVSDEMIMTANLGPAQMMGLVAEGAMTTYLKLKGKIS